LERAVGSVLPQLDAHTEVLIVDNASSDDTVAVATRLAEGCAAVRFEREPVVGLAAARHKALRSARGQWVVFLDDDAVAEPGWLTAYLTFFRALPSDRVAAVGGAVSPEYEVIPPAWYSPTANRLDLGPQPVRVSARHGPWGCNIGYRREVALGAGGFDPALGRRDCVMGAHEETELNLRLERAGYEVWWLPQAHIRHRVGKERLRFGWCLRAAFQSGYTKAVVRRQARGRGTAWTLWRLGRLLGTPWHTGLNLVVAALTWPWQKGRLAAAASIRAAEVAGFGWQLLQPMPKAAGPASGATAAAQPTATEAGGCP
jgi:GT2 family glycosyltransferase